MGMVNDDGDDGTDTSQFENELAALMGGEAPKGSNNNNPKKERWSFYMKLRIL